MIPNNKHKYYHYATWPSETLERISQGKAVACSENDVHSKQSKRWATYYLNKRAGLHKTASPAQTRALSLGQLQFTMSRVIGRIHSALTRFKGHKDNTDMSSYEIDTITLSLENIIMDANTTLNRIKKVSEECVSHHAYWNSVASPSKLPKSSK